MEEEIHLENREDLNVLLKETPYKYILLKFTADWCKPCKVIQPFLSDCVNEKIKDLDQLNKKNIFLYIEVDVDVCFDLYAFLKKKKAINGIPALFLYKTDISRTQEESYMYLPHAFVSGTSETEIKKVFELIQ